MGKWKEYLGVMERLDMKPHEINSLYAGIYNSDIERFAELLVFFNHFGTKNVMKLKGLAYEDDDRHIFNTNAFVVVLELAMDAYLYKYYTEENAADDVVKIVDTAPSSNLRGARIVSSFDKLIDYMVDRMGKKFGVEGDAKSYLRDNRREVAAEMLKGYVRDYLTVSENRRKASDYII